MLKILLGFFTLLIINQAQAEPLPVTEIATGVYVHQGVHEDLSEGYHGDICNIGFIVGSKGVAVIDSGGSLKIGKSLREAVRVVTPLPILYVINTHVHPDHIFGNAAFVEDKAEFVGHYKLAEAMDQRKETYLRINENWLGAEFTGSVFIKPSIAVQKNMTLDLGDRQLELTAYPTAHTNNDLTVLDNKTASLWTGDLLFVERTPSFDGELKGWLEAVKTLKTSSAKRMVPGHGAVVSHSQTALNNEERYLALLLSDIRASIKKGESMEKTMGTAAASEKNNWVLFETINRRNVNLIYPMLEWE
ncbi:MAG: quinoprotein relay system zinc metallohydrolase 2 [Methylophilaceae bacterium]